jgi:S1-C subfamily serine protease
MMSPLTPIPVRRSNDPMKRIIAALVLLTLATTSGSLHSSTYGANKGYRPIVTAVRIGDHASKTRIVFDLSEKVSFSLFSLADPYRLFIDLSEVDWRHNVDTVRSGKRVTGFRFGLYRSGQSRAVIDVARPFSVTKGFIQEPDKYRGYRLVIDLVDTSRKAFLSAIKRNQLARYTNRTPPAPHQLEKASTGSGFFVSPAGHILTNEHVVSRCREVRVAGAGNVEQIGASEKIDLALLKLDHSKTSAATFRDGRGIRTGDDIVVTGYPLQGLLSSELNVTKGIVSSLSGPGDDHRVIQITAPVQPGNSGGPVLDASGNVVGVVMAGLSAIEMVQATGAMPQNVNFAVSAGSARAFLDSHDVPYETARSDRPKPTADIAAKAKGYTVLIECWK